MGMICVVVYGNPIDGIRLAGSFDNFDEANGWSDEHVTKQYDWWVVSLTKSPPSVD